MKQEILMELIAAAHQCAIEKSRKVIKETEIASSYISTCDKVLAFLVQQFEKYSTKEASG